MIAIIDYKAGNLTSVKRALDHLGYESVITSDPQEVLGADRVIFPGVGAAASAMADLKNTGMAEVLKEVYKRNIPLLGICLGTQIIFERSEEGDTECLGILPGTVKAFPRPLIDPQTQDTLKVPHMGWNRVKLIKKHPVFSDIDPQAEFYFVHSYHPVPEYTELIYGITEYGIKFVSVVAHRGVVATQFHPEKSGRPGLKILENFCQWRPYNVK